MKTPQLLLLCALSLSIYGCSRGNSVYSDPSAAAIVTPVSTDGRAFLPQDFYNQSVNAAVVELQPDGVSATSKAIKFQTSQGANLADGFNGAGVGNRALLGLGGWHGQPVNQAEPITFDAKAFAGTELIGLNLQLDLKCDGSLIHVVNAAGSRVAAQGPTVVSDGYYRYTVSSHAPIWLSPTSVILDPDDATTALVPASGAAVSLTALLAKYPAACLKNAVTGAVDLPRAVPTAAILWNLGEDTTVTANAVFVRRLTVGASVFAELE